jgi:hypothetical protein
MCFGNKQINYGKECNTSCEHVIFFVEVLQVRDIVLGHVVEQKLTLDDLMAMPKDEITPTLLPGNSLKLSTAGATTGGNAGKVDCESIVLLKGDIDACAPNSTMHTIRALLPIANLQLPPTAATLTGHVNYSHKRCWISLCFS